MKVWEMGATSGERYVISVQAEWNTNGYINYTSDVMLAIPIMNNICDVRSMQGMTRTFNSDACIANTALITGQDELEELPHYVTVNEFLSRLNPDELSAIRTKMIKSLIRKRCL